MKTCGIICEYPIMSPDLQLLLEEHFQKLAIYVVKQVNDLPKSSFEQPLDTLIIRLGPDDKADGLNLIEKCKTAYPRPALIIRTRPCKMKPFIIWQDLM